MIFSSSDNNIIKHKHRILSRVRLENQAQRQREMFSSRSCLPRASLISSIMFFDLFFSRLVGMTFKTTSWSLNFAIVSINWKFSSSTQESSFQKVFSSCSSPRSLFSSTQSTCKWNLQRHQRSCFQVCLRKRIRNDMNFSIFSQSALSLWSLLKFADIRINWQTSNVTIIITSNQFPFVNIVMKLSTLSLIIEAHEECRIDYDMCSTWTKQVRHMNHDWRTLLMTNCFSVEI